MNIILHVGTEKTGSTAIQSVLKDSYRGLLSSGYLFPTNIGEPCHIKLTACALGGLNNSPIRKLLGIEEEEKFRQFTENTRESLRSEIKKTNPKTLVISDEHINAHLAGAKLLAEYKKVIEEFGTVQTVIIYLRRQDYFRLSLFAEAVKSGNLTHFDTDDLLPVFDRVPPRFDYLNILQNLEEVFGKECLIPRVFDRSTFPDRNVVNDFIDACSLPLPHDAPNRNEKNTSIDGRVIRPLAKVSSFIQKAGLSNKLRNSIISRLSGLFAGPSIVLEPSVHRSYMRQFESQNRQIKEKYFSHLPGNKLFESGGLDGAEQSDAPVATLSWPELFTAYARSCEDGLFKYEPHKDDNRNLAPPKKTPHAAGEGETVKATCSLCGCEYLLRLDQFSREGKLCTACGASGRSQAIGFYISSILCSNTLPLKSQKKDFTKRVVGLSDGKIYADILSRKFSYVNTYYHRKPYLDIKAPHEKYEDAFDLLISADVFEHVTEPTIDAFVGAFRILKPGGYLVLTVPFVNKGEAIEHYPGAVGYRSYKDKDGTWVAEIEYKNGEIILDRVPKFHGGPGKTLEMRIFNRARVVDELKNAGFVDIQVHDENLPQHGINWSPPSRVITARKGADSE